MAAMKKLLGFRQLSLNCDNLQPPARKHTLKKQFSEERRSFKEWSDDLNIQINLNDRNPFIKHAWVDPIDTINDEPVIIKKCTENRRLSSGKLTRQASLENDSLLTKQDFQNRLRQNLKPAEEKPNLKIFLSQNHQEYADHDHPNPKIIKPLTAGISNNEKNSFKLRKNIKAKATAETLWQVPNNKKTDDNINNSMPDTSRSLSDGGQLGQEEVCNGYVKPIASVIIRPTTAASKREMFQKRTNSAFNATFNKDVQDPRKPRRPLIRSSSAPCKPEHLKSKLIFQKNRKTFKKIQLKTTPKSYDIDKNEENSKGQHGSPVPGADVVTMVSLISPAGSDCEEEDDEEVKMKTKNVNFEKSTIEPNKPTPKIMSLRKAVKTVSFQQSSIHAIRSFSASFPARRSSVSAAMMMNNSLNSSSSKVLEKRSTNSTKPDDDERMPKRRLVRNKEDTKTASFNPPENVEQTLQNDKHPTLTYPANSNDAEKPDLVANNTANNEEKSSEESKNKESDIENLDLKSPKEKQCWNMYCKMTEKGINVSFDTILRGMLTPTEYRLSRRHSLKPTITDSPKST